MPNPCKFKRVNGHWEMTEDCANPKGPCVGIPNSRVLGTDHTLGPIQGAGNDTAFRDNFRSLTAFGPAFTFSDDNILEIACRQASGPLADQNSVYQRPGVAGFLREFRVVQAGPVPTLGIATEG